MLLTSFKRHAQGLGLKHLLNHWDLNEANVMAFGDGDNDIELLRKTSHSYAMENASPALCKCQTK